MEMRSLTRCLRARPTTTSLRQPLRPFQSLRFNSSDSNSNPNPTPTPTPTPYSKPGRVLNSPGPAFSALFKTTRSPQPSTRTLKPTTTAAGKPKPRSKSQNDIDALLNDISFNQTRRVENYEQNQAEAREKLRIEQEKAKPDLKLGPTLGRQFAVSQTQGGHLRRALQKLNTSLMQNNVKGQSIQQKYHIRKGQLRKTLKIKRWRALFKMSFAHTVRKIQRMQAQGW